MRLFTLFYKKIISYKLFAYVVHLIYMSSKITQEGKIMSKNIYLNKKNGSKKKKNIYLLVALAVIMSIIILTVSGCSSKSKNNIEKKENLVSNVKTTKSTNNEIETTNATTQQNVTINGYNYSAPVPVKNAVDNSYFNDAVFIGNSRTEGFMLYSDLSNATYYTHKGLMVNTAFTTPAININGERVSVMDAIKQNKKYKKVYIMLGINELGWSYSNLYVKKYGAIIDTIKHHNPNTKIFIQSLIPVSASKSKSDKIYNNKKIGEYNSLLQKLASNKKVYYVNVAKALSDCNGCLPEDASFDGVHLKKTYCQKWLEYLKTHTV